MNQRIEITKAKGTLFAIIITPIDDFDLIISTLYKNQACDLKKEKLVNIKAIYQKIKNKQCYSLDEIYCAFGNEIRETNVFKPHKAKIVFKYRKIINDFFNATKNQVIQNQDSINICSLTFSIFNRLQKINKKNPEFNSKHWFNGIINQQTIKSLKNTYESYANSSQELKHDKNFCLGKLTDLLNGLNESIASASSIYFIDAIIHELHCWFFSCNNNYDFLIFDENLFNPIFNFFTTVIVENPFMCFVVEDINGIELCSKNPLETANNIIALNEKHLTSLDYLTDVKSALLNYINIHQSLRHFGMFDFECYELNAKVTKLVSIAPTQDDAIREFEKNLSSCRLVLTIKSEIDNPENVIKTKIRPTLNAEIRARRKQQLTG